MSPTLVDQEFDRRFGAEFRDWFDDRLYEGGSLAAFEVSAHQRLRRIQAPDHNFGVEEDDTTMAGDQHCG